MLITVKKIDPTGQRHVPSSCIGKTGKVLGKVHHHGRGWTRVGFKGEKTFSTMCLGSPYYDFLDDEIEEVVE